MGPAWLIRAGAGAAAVGGACWVLKAASILITGDQPPLLFALSFVLFPVALVGLYAVMTPNAGLLARCGLGLAIAAEVSAVIVGLGKLLGPRRWVPREDTATILTPFIVVAGFGMLIALLLLGIAARRTVNLPRGYRTVPFLLAMSTVPLVLLGGLLEQVDERLLEVPILLLGFGWLALGVLLARARALHPLGRRG